MGKIKVHEFTSLDGAIGAPTWTMDYGFPDDLARAIDGFMASCTGILLGRTTYQEFGPAWSSRTADEDPGAPFFNHAPKYVISSTLRDPDWGPVTVLGNYDRTTVEKLKVDADGDLYVSGSGTLVRALLADGLVDELHLIVYPVALGQGPYLFPPRTEPTPLTLAAVEELSNGAVHLSYGPAI
ncbi:dihydrofolate reductase family protein [Pseudonocardia kujensis]|uniref:dihydrofolate reductase family protein n=1 Tax=Pseudonocardia kujensis TaxID=1128675 RepID=UPI001E50E794|nr:dihydrofolate reductase family protein [Pseudonocardia kujensis]MCE0768313.1 dihydrofolate reductase family protein [Pseudonocardia kujensis]